MNRLLVKLEQDASEFRQKNGLSATEPIRLKSLLQKNIVLTACLPLSGTFSGMAIKVNKGESIKRFILINSNHTLGRQHFTICHELYHLYYQEDFESEKSVVGLYNKSDIEEYKADYFASYLLLPRGGIIQMIPEKELVKNKITLKTLLEIEHYYSCSRKALLHRLLDLGIIDKSVFDEYDIDKIKNALLHGYNSDLYSPANEGLVVGDYGSKAKELFDKGMISESSYFSLLEEIGVDLSNFDEQEDND